jgi:hypothetical protein
MFVFPGGFSRICRSVLFSSFLSSGLLAQGPSSELLKPLSSSRELGDLNAELQALAAHISPSVVKIEVNGYLPVRDPASPNAALLAARALSVPALLSIRPD